VISHFTPLSSLDVQMIFVFLADNVKFVIWYYNPSNIMVSYEHVVID
jgi:hypothetical protein